MITVGKSLKDEQRLILKVISMLGESTSLIALQVITKMSFWDLETNLAELIEMSLVETNLELERENIRYGILALTRTYVLNTLGDDSILQNTLKTLASDYYLDFCDKHRKVFSFLHQEIENLRIVMSWCRSDRQEFIHSTRQITIPIF